METCITIWHWPNHDRWFDEGLKKSLGQISNAGFTHINWNPDSGSSYWYARSEIAFIQSCIDEAGLKTKTVHATNGVNDLVEMPGLFKENRKDIHSPHQWQREAAVELLQNRIDLAVALGSPDVVLHIDVRDEFHVSKDAREAFYVPLFSTLDAIRPYCLETGVKIAAENLFRSSAKTQLEMFEVLFERYDLDFLGLCYDSGHWEMLEPGGFTLLERFGHRLITTHIHDNYRAKDDHLLPFEGRIDWDGVAKGIASSPYVGPVNLETPPDSYTISADAFYGRAHTAASRLEGMIASYRGNPGC